MPLKPSLVGFKIPRAESSDSSRAVLILILTIAILGGVLYVQSRSPEPKPE